MEVVLPGTHRGNHCEVIVNRGGITDFFPSPDFSSEDGFLLPPSFKEDKKMVYAFLHPCCEEAKLTIRKDD